MTTVGEALVAALAAHGVNTVFGIPGVHTIELYRGLAASGIRHVTPRHEQGAAFMADGYARATGRPGVAFVITGPGVANTLTPMGQARADSVPILVVSGVNTRASLGQGLGHLHELPDQLGLVSKVALGAYRVERPEDAVPVVAQAIARLTSGRLGPVHIEVPLDLAGGAAVQVDTTDLPARDAAPDEAAIQDAARRLSQARAPLILAGGGAKHADLAELAERLDAPVVQTVNARGVMFDHPLSVPASPSLLAVRELIEASDLLLALGTELGPTDYDMYGRGFGEMPVPMIRVDICDGQLARRAAALTIQADSEAVVEALKQRVEQKTGNGADRAARARAKAQSEIGPKMRDEVAMLEVIRNAVPNAFFVGDSTQPIYAGNLYYDHDRRGGWFNAATGFGALGYAIPAAIGVSVAEPDAPVICLTGDGGAQFSIAELMTAKDENLPITFIVWNNHGYGEIAASMREAGVDVIGCAPTPPDFSAIATACGMPFQSVAQDADTVAAALAAWEAVSGPRILEIRAG